MNIYTRLRSGATFPATRDWPADDAARSASAFPGTCRIVIRGEYLKSLAEAGFDRFDAFMGRDLGDPIARSRTSRTVRCTLPGGPRIYVKSYYYTSWRSVLRGSLRNTWLGRSRARREWDSLELQEALGLPSVPRIALGECRFLGALTGCFLVTAEAPGETLENLAGRISPGTEATVSGDREPRQGLIRAVADLTRRMHDHHFVDGNFRFRNLLAAPGGDGSWDLVNLDSPRGRRTRRIARARLVDLASLRGDALRCTTRTERLRFLLTYLGHRRLTPDARDLARRIEGTAR